MSRNIISKIYFPPFYSSIKNLSLSFLYKVRNILLKIYFPPFCSLIPNAYYNVLKNRSLSYLYKSRNILLKIYFPPFCYVYKCVGSYNRLIVYIFIEKMRVSFHLLASIIVKTKLGKLYDDPLDHLHYSRAEFLTLNGKYLQRTTN